MTIKTIFGIALASVSLLTLSSGAFAQDPATKPGKRAQQGARRPQGSGLAQLDAGLRAAQLTPEQQAEVKALALKFRDEVFAKLTPEQQEKVKAAMMASPAAGAAGRQQAGGRQGRSPFTPMLAALDLTDDQKTKIDPIVSDAQKKLTDTMRAARDGSSGGKGAGKEARQAMQNILTETKAQIRPLLTPEQQTKLDAYQPPTRAAGKGKKAKDGGTPPPTTGGAFGSGGQ
jgi:Spy/CpxP family protein refolding chaperone